MHLINITLLVVVIVVKLSVLNVVKGEKQHRIYKGKIAKPHSAPYQVGLIISYPNRKLLCSGCLIKPRFILTAAHCIEDPISINVIIGVNELYHANKFYNYAEVLNYVRHRNYNPDTIENDIAMIELRNPVELSDKIGLVLLPNKIDPLSLVGRYGKVTGWGITTDKIDDSEEILKELKVFIVSNKKCLGYQLDSSYLCGYGESNGSVCIGDSGSPLVLEKTDILIGIASFGSVQGCTLGYPHVYTNVLAYLRWIAKWST